ncbi:MAG: hypothetical protein H6943_09120 [Zoogloeaceae bacterium]|nr:hypothetical protein [Zoogloeaceae bacterium]
MFSKSQNNAMLVVSEGAAIAREKNEEDPSIAPDTSTLLKPAEIDSLFSASAPVTVILIWQRNGLLPRDMKSQEGNAHFGIMQPFNRYRTPARSMSSAGTNQDENHSGRLRSDAEPAADSLR